MPASKSAEAAKPVTFDAVLAAELEQIAKSRIARRVDARARPKTSLVGLAFSGGGIRSATFNLGILQALAGTRLLHKFDYLSTVSGGGYIGSWLAALISRFTKSTPPASIADVEQALRPGKYEPNQRAESSALHWLRMYSNYLTPHTGVVSGDTWAMLGTWMRNVILNQIILGLMFVSSYLLCMSVLIPMVFVAKQDNAPALLTSGGLILFFASVSMAVNIVREAPPKVQLQTFFQRIRIAATVMLPFVMACVLLNCALWQRTDLSTEPTWEWALAGAAFYFLVWGFVAIMAWLRRAWPRKNGKLVWKTAELVNWVTGRRPKDSEEVRHLISISALLIFSPIAGATGACLLQAYCYLLNQPQDWDSSEWLVTVFGSSVVMAVVLLVGALHLGLVGRGSADLVREWWARLGGYLMLLTMGWVLLAGTCALAPLGLRWTLFVLPGAKFVTAAVLWVLHTYFGLKVASSSKTSGTEADPKAGKSGIPNSSGTPGKSGIMKALTSTRILNALAKSAPYVFLVGLVVLLTTVMHIAVGVVSDAPDMRELWLFKPGFSWSYLSGDYWQIMKMGSPTWLALLGGSFFLGGLGLSCCVDVNDFSLHHFYRNRLVRCYLGASNPDRKPEPFTGFDPGDDVALYAFAENYPGPYPILNAALNITSGEDLGYATRRAKSFVFTPLYCGYQRGIARDGRERFTCEDGFLPTFARTELGRTAGGHFRVRIEGGISLGTAMAISGAAASPNMGYYTAAATAFFMALFDVRLGWWMGNPAWPRKWKSPGPRLGLWYLLSELFAHSDQERGYVYLSDGGHFENLGVYELIRRHCRLIVSCDADADPSYQFDNLLSLIEKARTDFGARIEIDYAAIQPDHGGRQSKRNWVTGTIYYDPNHCNDTGVLILIKASMPAKPIRGVVPRHGDERSLPDDVWRYYDQHVTFPHQSTADQWFDELQFESYRALGECIGLRAASEIGKAIDDTLARRTEMGHVQE